MSTPSRSPFRHAALGVALAVLTAAGTVAAQPRPAPAPTAKPKGAELSAQQRRAIHKIVLDAAVENAETRAGLQKARLELHRMMLEDRPDAAALDRKAAEIGELQGRLLRARLDTQIKVRAQLTPEQRERLGPRLMHHLMGGGMRHHGAMRGMRRMERGPDGPDRIRIERFELGI